VPLERRPRVKTIGPKRALKTPTTKLGPRGPEKKKGIFRNRPKRIGKKEPPQRKSSINQ